ncbi:hypothetical protein FRUB_03070 [Fimbriiglobus ruber]|uniref:Uncharacterized protein n=1 Tax=Fimbriiglobus ruber TaxID=1908690 RepID=A0A225DQA5_9BACT|nr:hypothetical protein FRUB_03070 [Fimbriiglobus ruber]
MTGGDPAAVSPNSAEPARRAVKSLYRILEEVAVTCAARRKVVLGFGKHSLSRVRAARRGTRLRER